MPGHGDPSYDVAHYELDLAYGVDGNRLDGRRDSAAVAVEDLDRLVLDLHAAACRKVTVDGRPAGKYTHRATGS